MTTDRELIEAAARAAGMEGEYIEGYGIYLPPANPSASQLYWQPLTDDADAFRLAVKLQIHPEIFNSYTIVQYVDPATDDWTDLEEWDDDPYAATRRAIVRAAAEMGKT